MSASKQFIAKSVILLLLILLWVSAGCFIFLGSYALHAAGDIAHVAQSSYVLIPAIICLSVGLILFVLGLLGCFACTMEHKAMLVLFFSLILIVFLGQIAAAVCGIVFRNELSRNVERALENELDKYDEDKSLSREIDFIQSTYQCCGVRNTSDWYNTTWSHGHQGALPGSCCQGGNCTQIPMTTIAPIVSTVSPKSLQQALSQALDDAKVSFVKTVHKIQQLLQDPVTTTQQLSTTTTASTTTGPTAAPPTPLPPGSVFPEPCLTKMEKIFRRNFGWMATLAVLFAVLEFMGLVATWVVMQRSDEVRYEQFGIVTENLTV